MALKDFLGEYSYPADPLDELETPNYPKEASVDYAFSEDDLKLDREERARYGVSSRDMWNFYSHWLNIFARGVRQLRNECTDPERYDMFDQLLDAIIAVNEVSESNTLPVESDKEKSDKLFKEWQGEWLPKSERFADLVENHWLDISDEAKGTWNKGSALVIVDKMKKTSSFTDRRKDISDPITWTLDESVQEKHHAQRAENGFSEWDLVHFRTYLVWLLAQGCAYFSSDSSHGYPGREPWETAEKWNDFLIDFMGRILSGEAAMCMTRAHDRRVLEEDQKRYREAMKEFPHFLTLLWD